MEQEDQIDVSMIGVESLERDQGGYKYLYCELKYMCYNILENIPEYILEPSSSRTFQRYVTREYFYIKYIIYKYMLISKWLSMTSY